MDGSAFRLWRETAGLTQAEAAEKAGVTRVTVARAEAADNKPVPFKLATITEPELEPEAVRPKVASKKAAKGAAKLQRAAAVADQVKGAPVAVPAALKAAMLRNPPYAKTSAEAKAMRQLRADQKGVPPSTIRLIPLQPDWTRLASGRQVNAAIPAPLDVAAPAWAGERGVQTASGVVYDYETAHKMRGPEEFGVAQAVAGDW